MFSFFKLLLLLQNLIFLFNCQQIKLNYLVGEINHNVQIVNGEAIVTVPVPKLKGLNDLMPSLDLVYRSSQYLQNKELGLGWSLSGLSEISRCFKTVSQDTSFDNIKFNASDRFCLDGQRIVAVDGVYGWNQTTYKTEIDGLSKIVSFSTGQNSTPSYFKVFTKNNLIYTYGSTDNSTLGPIGSIATNKWLLNKIEDYVGNSIKYFYFKESNYCYLSSISYANRFINLTYSDRKDKQTKYYDSKIDISINKILSSILLLVNDTKTGSLVETQRLKFEYQEYGPASLSILKQVNQCYPDLTCLSPLVFQYEGEKFLNESFSNAVYQHNICGAFTNSVCELKQMVDMNGDGRMDVVAFGFDGVYVSLNMGSYFDPAKIWSGEFSQSTGWVSSKHLRYILDMNNDGLPDIVGFGDNGFYVSLNQNSFMKAMEKWHDKFGTSTASGGWASSDHRFLGDLNNDGYYDFIGYKSTGIQVAYGNVEKKFGNLFGLALENFSTNGWGTSLPIYFNDLNSDGFPDFMGYGGLFNEYYSMNMTSSPTRISSLTNSLSITGSTWSTTKNTRLFSDLNGDNLPDLFGIDDSNNVIVGVSVANADSISQYKFNLSIWSTLNKKTTNRYQTLADVNSDGFLDLLVFDCDGVYVLLNNGNLKFNSPAKLWNNELKLCDQIANNPKQVVDVDGDGLVDIVEFIDVNVRIAFNANKKPRLIQITDSLNNVKEVQYDRLSNALFNFKTINDENYRTSGLNPDVVRFFTSSNGIAGKSIIDYQYGYYTCSRTQGRNACSFSSIKYRNIDSQISFIDEYFYEYPLTGLIRSKKSFINKTLLTEKYYNYKVKTLQNLKFTGASAINQLSLSNSTSNYFDSNGVFLKTELSLFSYDDLGNIFSQIDNITDNKLNSSKTSIFQYKNSILNVKNWYLSQLESKRETLIIQYENGNIDSKSLQQTFEYDSDKRLLMKITNLPGEKIGLEQSFIYDQFGNVVTSNRKDLWTSEVRSKSYLYDPNGINIIVSINELNQSTAFAYDLMDNILNSTDLNGVVLTYQYNQAGKKILEKSSDSTSKTIAYSWDISHQNSVYNIMIAIDGGTKVKTVYDSLNRAIRTVNYGFKLEEIFEDTIYDANGLILKKSLPYKSYINEPYFVSFEYDAQYRQIKSIESGYTKNMSNNYSILYTGLNVVKQDTLGGLKILKKNIFDQITSVQDALGSVSYYIYDTLNNLIRIIDPQGSITTMEYNLNNKLIKKSDTYNGVTEYEYNAFNEITAIKRSTFTVSFQHDKLGRLIKRSEPEGDTLWFYDTANKGIGRVHKIVSSSISKEFKYDNFSRRVETLDTIQNQIYSVKAKYDTFGRLAAEEYPSGLTVYNCFTLNGYLRAVSLNDSNCRSFIWKANEYDALRSILKEEYNNGMKTDYTYNSFNQITSIVSQSSNSLARKLEYAYDLRKNLVRKIDYDFRGKDIINKYSYDTLDRLTGGSTFERLQNVEKMTQYSSWNYDSIGNMLYSNDNKEKFYEYSLDKPQQVVKVGDENIYYDSNGNVIKTSAYQIDWTSFSKPMNISVNQTLMQFSYGPNRERVIKKSKELTVHYVNNFYEKWIVTDNNTVTTSEKFYIKVLNKIIAMKIVTNSSENLFYLNLDAFGSVESINDNGGKLLIKYNYTAFGYRGVSYSNVTSEIKAIFNLGFSSNDYIDSDRLINFNGRIYDSVLNRFLNPDPFIQEPYNIQNLNRYSYGLNNPFKYNDPSGFFFKKLWKVITNPTFIFAVVAAVATAGALSGLAATVAASVTSSTIGAGIISGAIVGAGSGFASSLVISNGNINAALQGALQGALGGGIVGGVNAFTSSPNIRFAAETLFDGVKNKIEKRDFFDGFDLSVLSYAASRAYKSSVGYEATYERGGSAAQKGEYSPPVKGANNIGTQGGRASFFSEGGPLSESLNKFGGVNAVAGLHDVFQTNLEGNLRDILNVPGMPIAAAVTYLSLYPKVQCPMCSEIK